MPNRIPMLIARMTAMESIMVDTLQLAVSRDPGLRKQIAERLRAMADDMRDREDPDTAAFVDLFRDDFMENT